MAKAKNSNPSEDKDSNQNQQGTPFQAGEEAENNEFNPPLADTETQNQEQPPPPENPVPAPKKVHAVCMRDCMAVVNGNADSVFVRQGERVQIMTDAPGFCHFTELGDVQA